MAASSLEPEPSSPGGEREGTHEDEERMRRGARIRGKARGYLVNMFPNPPPSPILLPPLC
uniref:Uncharacterized protein n=1 Tax=Arundo donax TaxID=35708 RepID=A0A0A9BVF1_ARUDO